MLKNLPILSLCILFGINTISFGQSISRSSLSCLGSTISENGYILRQTIGQSSNTEVVNNGIFVLRQGFQQPIISSITPELIAPIDFTLSPNPAQEKTFLEIHGEIPSYSVIISNLNGMPLNRINDQNILARWLDLNDLLPGIYIVTIISEKKMGSKKLIIKH